jgi:hypothetical protein
MCFTDFREYGIQIANSCQTRYLDDCCLPVVDLVEREGGVHSAISFLGKRCEGASDRLPTVSLPAIFGCGEYLPGLFNGFDLWNNDASARIKSKAD